MAAPPNPLKKLKRGRAHPNSLNSLIERLEELGIITSISKRVATHQAALNSLTCASMFHTFVEKLIRPRTRGWLGWLG
jgi:hypothetical protein